MKVTSLCIKVRREVCEPVIRVLRNLGVLRSGLKVLRDGDYVYIPVENEFKSVDISKHLTGVDFELCNQEFEVRGGIATFKDLLKDVVPGEVLSRIPRSFDIVGDIALINLPEDVLNYGSYVGNAILSINRNVRAVYAVGPTLGDYRVRKLTHLAGVQKSETVHKEYGILIYVDLARAYYNPSLSFEHFRVASEARDNELVLDLFSGVGPFTLHIVSRCMARVVAIDINPHAIYCLLRSLRLNGRRLKGYVTAINGDASYMLKAFREAVFDRIIMNLPHKAINYIKEAHRVCRQLGTIYLYHIAGHEFEVVEAIDSYMGGLGYEILDVVKVLDYAPRKYIYRVKIIKR